MRLILKGGRVIDGACRRDETADVVVEDGKISSIGQSINVPADSIYDCTGMIITAGLVDGHVHLREPGFEHKGTIHSETKAAAKGGFTQIVAMANLNPVPDSILPYQKILALITNQSCVKVEQACSISKGLEGRELSDIRSLVGQGVNVFSDDGRCLMNTCLLYQALLASEEYGFILSLHEEDDFMKRFSATGMLPVNEAAIIARDIEVLRVARGHMHLQHISTKRSVELIRQAKDEGLDITAEVAPHHLLLTCQMIESEGTNAKMSPPLRTQEDIEALVAGLNDGTIDFIASDHAPHSAEDKEVPFEKAANGIIGLETTLALLMTEFVYRRGYSPVWLLDRLSGKPAKRFGLAGGSLKLGTAADICVISPAEWVIQKEQFVSKGHNSPFGGRPVKGRAAMTLVDGKVVYSTGEVPIC